MPLRTLAIFATSPDAADLHYHCAHHHCATAHHDGEVMVRYRLLLQAVPIHKRTGRKRLFVSNAMNMPISTFTPSQFHQRKRSRRS